jgi:1,4-alpha-glucan branching enzyme
LSLIRWSRNREEHIICVLNFTPVPRENYRIGVPILTDYEEILNTDSGHYSGSHCENQGTIKVEQSSWSGLDQSVSITLPPLAAVFLKPKK